MSPTRLTKVLASITPDLGIEAVPHGEITIRNDGMLNEWNVTFTVVAGEIRIAEWVLSDFGSYSVAFNAAARKALEISIERDLIIHVIREVTE